jgi:hypothetical protein
MPRRRRGFGGVGVRLGGSCRKFSFPFIPLLFGGENSIFTNTHFQSNSPNTPVYTLLATSPPGAKQQGRANEPDFVAILLSLIRLKDQKTDILVTVNVPHVKGEYEAGSVDLEHGRQGSLIERAGQWRERVLETFEVREWGLFGEE